jgi:hypothetical protein
MDELYTPLHSMFLDSYVHNMDVQYDMFVLLACNIMHSLLPFHRLSWDQV